MEGRRVNKIEKQACFGGDCRPVPVFLPIKIQKQVVDRVGDNQRSEPPRPNKPSSESIIKCQARTLTRRVSDVKVVKKEI